MPLALDLISTLVMGSMGPVATTDLAMLPRVTLARRLAGSFVPRRVAATPPMTMAITATRMMLLHSHQRRFRLLCV